MNRYLEKQRDDLLRIRAFADSQDSSLHRAMIENYLRHASLEIGFDPERWSDLFCDEMMVSVPVYHVQLAGDPETITYKGDDEIKAFYSSMAAAYGGLQTHDPILLAVADWGVSILEEDYVYLTGSEARELGYTVDDQDAHYRLKQKFSSYWRFDGDARLEGEDIFQLTGGEITKMEPDEVFSREELLAVVAPFQGGKTIRR
jgi:hypothetical protein